MSLAPLHRSKTAMMMHSSVTHTGLPPPKPTLQWATPAPSPELEVSQQGQADRVNVQDHRLKVLPPSPAQALLGGICVGTHYPQGSLASAGRGDLSFSLMSHTGLSGSGSCPSPAYLAADVLGEKQRQSPAGATSQLPGLTGTRTAPWGVQATYTCSCRAIWPCPMGSRSRGCSESP